MTLSLLILSAAAASAAPIPQLQSTPLEGLVHDASGELVYTRSAAPEALKKVGFSYADGVLALGEPIRVATLPSAEGLLLAEDQGILVAGGGDEVFKVDPESGVFETIRVVGGGAEQVMMSPEGGRLFVAGQAGGLVQVPSTPFGGNGTPRVLKGDDASVTSMVWVENEVFYASRGEDGSGSFGRLDLLTFETTRLIAPLPGAREMVLDPYTGHLLLFGGDFITQIDPGLPTEVVASLSFTGHEAFAGPEGYLQSGTTNGGGLIFGSVRSGYVAFVDYTSTGRVNQADLVDVRFLETGLRSVGSSSSQIKFCENRRVARNYGDGWAGTLGIPTITAPLPPINGGEYQIQISNSLGLETKGCLLISKAPVAQPTRWDGLLNVEVNPMTHTITLNPIPAAGTIHTVTLPPLTPETCAIECYLQVIMQDPGATKGVSFTDGLEIRLGAE